MRVILSNFHPAKADRKLGSFCLGLGFAGEVMFGELFSGEAFVHNR